MFSLRIAEIQYVMYNQTESRWHLLCDAMQVQ